MISFVIRIAKLYHLSREILLKCKQYSVKVFEIGFDNPNTFRDFINTNYVLIKNHLISIKGKIDEDSIRFLDEKGLKYVCNMELPRSRKGVSEFCITENSITTTSDNTNHIEEDTTDDTAEDKMEPLKIVKGALRSGQYIEHNGDVLSTGRINSGAKIAAMGSVIALGKVEGDISSVGDCIITTPTTKGNILFHGTRIDGEKLIFPLNLIKFDGEDIVIQPISKKEII